MIVVDRFEGDFAVLETDEGMIDVERTQLADDICEGDVIMKSDGIYIKDSETTRLRHEKIIALRNKLMKGG